MIFDISRKGLQREGAAVCLARVSETLLGISP